MSLETVTAFDVLDFWWTSGGEKWFAGGESFDQDCRSRFLATIEAAQKGELDDWAETPHGALALLIVLDQLTRNVFRGEPRAFAADARALALAEAALAKGFDRAFPKEARFFFYLPFEHAEDMAAQERCVDLCRSLGVQEYYHYALIHMDVIRRFGRFPHRNPILGRDTTPAEAAYLADGGFSA